MRFKDHLNEVLSEEGLASPQNTKAANDLVMLAAQLQDTITRSKQSLEDAEMQLQNILGQLNTKLGWEIRKRQPKLMITHKGNRCNAGYFSQFLSFQPDLTTKQWNIEGPLSKHFRDRCQDKVTLSSDLGPLADEVVNFFKDRYRTLQT